MLQVVATGLQDRERLNVPQGKPSVQFYKSVMRRRTRWASQWRRVEFDNLADFGRTAICTLPIQGELITRATLVIDLPDIYTPQLDAIKQQYVTPHRIVAPSWAWTNAIGHAICSDVQMLIGDAIIDRFDSCALEVIDEQTRPVEHFDSTNQLIARDPTTFTDQQTIQINGTGVPGQSIAVPQTNPQTLEIVFPFWWNRGPGPQALPIQALWKDKVQLKVTFRPVQECVYTSTRIDPRNPPLSSNQGTGPVPNIAGCGFFVKDTAGQPIYSASSSANLLEQGLTDGFNGSVITSATMPSSYHFTDAYWIVEYVSLEDREAAAYRMADLEIPIEQHVPMPVVTTGGARDLRIRMDHAGLVRDLTWVAQRVEAPSYNAHFLFSKDLGPAPLPPTLIGPTPLIPVQNPCDIPWWPNAQIPDWDFGDGYIVPAFATRNSDPIASAMMQIRGLTRFEHEGPSVFRSLIPALNCKRVPLIDRYIYRYDFGFWPTGGLAEAADLPIDEIRGCANWDKLPKRELILSMNQSSCGSSKWVIDTSQDPLVVTADGFAEVDPAFAPTTDGFLVSLVGAQPRMPDGSVDTLGNNGDGATVLGIVDFHQIRRQMGYSGLYVRTNDQGSASLVMHTSAGYKWIAVAAGGGYGQILYGGGGYAGSAAEIGWQGGNNAQTNAAESSVGGIYTYSNSTMMDSTALISIITSPLFSMIVAGTFQTLELECSLEGSIIPTVSVTLYVNGAATELTPPTTPVTLPVGRFTLTSPTPISVQFGDDVYVSFEVIDNGLSTVRTNHNTPVLSVTLRFKEGGIVGSNTLIYGGGGGCSSSCSSGVGQPDGVQMLNTQAFVESHDQTGGTTFAFQGGDGYYGGGSGTRGGGGGGSYVSELIGQVNTFENLVSTDVIATLTPLKRETVPSPNFNIYSWLTRYNRLRINSGRGALMFNETT